MIETFLEFMVPWLLLSIAIIFVYVSSIVIEERKRQKRIPLIWEKGFWKKDEKD